jgi:hypothetical protein
MFAGLKVSAWIDSLRLMLCFGCFVILCTSYNYSWGEKLPGTEVLLMEERIFVLCASRGIVFPASILCSAKMTSHSLGRYYNGSKHVHHALVRYRKILTPPDRRPGSTAKSVAVIINGDRLAIEVNR